MNESKNVLITGASTGIGYDLAKVFINSGYKVFGSVRKKEDANRLENELGEGFEPLLFDVTDHKAVDEAASLLTEKIGGEGLGGLINNAGVAVGGPFMDLDMEELRYQFEVNVIGLVKVTQAFLPLLGARDNHPVKPGRILQISSVAGKLSMPFLSPYAGSKHAVEGISQSLRRELQLFGIDVTIIGPGPIKTPIWNKGTGQEQDTKYAHSPFYKSLKIFQDVFVVKAIKRGWSSDKAAKIILGIYEKTNPKTRYSLVPQRFKNWTLPRLLPDRTLDKFVKKNLKLFK
ncbi:MAG: SDR family NAD(P)-dependent oxidoreductase [Cyclobacteriaceae bacterium]